MKNRIRSIGYIMCFTIALFAVSCTDGYKDDETFTSDVRNTQLESPDASSIKVTTVMNQVTKEEEFKIEWSVVHGAGGYLFSLYIVDDPDNPVIVGEKEQFVDGCVIRMPKLEDTKYNIVIKTLGNEKYNNKGAASASEITYSTLIPVHETIPSGTDLGDYFANNPVQPQGEDVAEVVYQLEANGMYTMKSNVALKSTNVTLRGDKIYRPQITVSGASSFISDGAGFKIRWCNIDLDEYIGDAFIQYNTTIDETNPNVIYYNSDPWVVIEASSGLESCNITNLKTSLISDKGKKYALKNFTFNDCIVEQHAASKNPFINFTGAIIKDLTMLNSTFYNHNKSYGSNWIVFANVRVWQVADRNVWATEGGNINIKNSTFWQIAYGKQIYNCNGWAQQNNKVIVNYVTVQNSIFVDTGNKQILRRLRMQSANVGLSSSSGYNTYWYDGVFAEDEIDYTHGDKTGTEIRTNPQFADPSNGNFTISGSGQIAASIGDPRWLP